VKSELYLSILVIVGDQYSMVDMAVAEPYTVGNFLLNPYNPLGNCPTDSSELPCS
jgi:hypothetical protein